MSDEVFVIPTGPNELLPDGVKKIELKPEYKQMMEIITQTSPMMNKATENFNKTQSQFMDNMLTVSHPTILRNARQVLAEVNKAKMALREAALGCAEKEIDIEILKEQLTGSMTLQERKIKIQIAKLENEISATMPAVEGAIRKVANYSEQYRSLMAAWGKDTFTEQDFEEQEEAYHIAKAFDQALTAARSRNGMIDEGNHIYFSQIGINGAAAQHCITEFLNREAALFRAEAIPNTVPQQIRHSMPGHGIVTDFLISMVGRFKGCSTDYAQRKGMSTSSATALLKS